MMQTRRLPKLGMELPLLGFGMMRLKVTNPDDTSTIDMQNAQEMVDYAMQNGINYFDTAYMYHNYASEGAVGKLLAKYPRESYFLTSKLPIWEVNSLEEAERVFEEQLARCCTDYFDFYFIHSIDAERYEKCKRLGIFDMLKKKQAQGKFRHFGFSCHDNLQNLRIFVDELEPSVVQVQINYFDWVHQDAKGLYAFLESRGIPVIVMEPVRGGYLANLPTDAQAILDGIQPGHSAAAWALKWVASLPGVVTILSAMHNMEQLVDNNRELSEAQPLSKEQFAQFEQVRRQLMALGSIPCTGCNYCADCPMGIAIPRIFAVYNDYLSTKNNFKTIVGYFNLLSEKERANNCIKCGKCASHCPQKIDIPQKLEELHGIFFDIFAKEDQYQDSQRNKSAK